MFRVPAVTDAQIRLRRPSDAANGRLLDSDAGIGGDCARFCGP